MKISSEEMQALAQELAGAILGGIEREKLLNSELIKLEAFKALAVFAAANRPAESAVPAGVTVSERLNDDTVTITGLQLLQMPASVRSWFEMVRREARERQAGKEDALGLHAFLQRKIDAAEVTIDRAKNPWWRAKKELEDKVRTREGWRNLFIEGEWPTFYSGDETLEPGPGRAHLNRPIGDFPAVARTLEEAQNLPGADADRPRWLGNALDVISANNPVLQRLQRKERMVRMTPRGPEFVRVNGKGIEWECIKGSVNYDCACPKCLGETAV